MGRGTVGTLEDKVVGGKGYRVEWATTSLVPLEEWTTYYIQSPTFKLWGNDLRLKIEISQELSQRKYVSMYVRLIPEDPKAWAKKMENTISFLLAKYDFEEIFDSRNLEGSITTPTTNEFHLNFILPLNEETGAPNMSGYFEIKLMVEKPETSCSLEVVNAALDRLHGLRHLSGELGQLLINPEGSDLTIRCRNQKFSIHKFILSARSTTLKKMMGELKESTLELDRVKDRSIDPRALKRVLEWIYTGQIKGDADELMDDMRALGDLWGLDELKSYCGKILDLNYRLVQSSVDANLEPPKKKLKTDKMDYNLVSGDLKVVPWKSRLMEWKVDLPKFDFDEIIDFTSPSVNFFGINWNLLMSLNYNAEHMQDAERLKDFKTLFNLSLQPNNGHWTWDALGVEPKLKFNFRYDDDEYSHHHNDNETADSDAEAEDSDTEIDDDKRVKRTNVNKYKFWEKSSLLNRFHEKEHKIKINWTLFIDFKNGIISDKMKREINFEKRSLNRFVADLGRMLDGEEGHDVVLRSDGKDFRAHKAILAARSDVFKVMFDTPMRESLDSVVEIKNGPAPGVLVGQDMVEILLRWMYTGELGELDEGQTMIMLGLADFYNLKKLKDLCEDKLMGLIRWGNVVDMLILAVGVQAYELKREVIKYIHKNPYVTHKPEFKDKVDWELLREIFIASQK